MLFWYYTLESKDGEDYASNLRGDIVVGEKCYNDEIARFETLREARDYQFGVAAFLHFEIIEHAIA